MVKGTEGTLLNSFLTSLDGVLERRIVRKYYLQWLRLLLDNISRQNLPELHRKYEKKRIELKKAKTDQCKQDMVKLNMKIINASFGLEHLLREMGQVYQAAKQYHNSRPHKYAHLPCVAAELLIDGYPLELMDGDAAHVPIHWVVDVLEKGASKAKQSKDTCYFYFRPTKFWEIYITKHCVWGKFQCQCWKVHKRSIYATFASS